ncbi:MAG: universal stress protein [Betaproteobacteria bacterium]|nr:universal stress protein [Betaproteobacteria bacterium]
MEKPAHILVATDLSSHAGKAETRAAMLAQDAGHEEADAAAYGAALPLQTLRAMFERTPLETEQILVNAAKAELARRARPLGEKFHIEVTPVVKVGRVHLGIVAHADEVNADLVVVGGYGAHLVRELFLGATAEKVLRTSTRPMLIVKQEPLSPYKRLLVPVDFSPSSSRALDWGMAIAAGAEINVAHVYEVPNESTLRYASVEDKVVEGYHAVARHQARDAMSAFLKDRRPAETDFQRHILHGHPAAGIRDLAEELRPDLIVMGKHGQSEIEKLLLGSVTRHMLFETHCDMLVAMER